MYNLGSLKSLENFILLWYVLISYEKKYHDPLFFLSFSFYTGLAHTRALRQGVLILKILIKKIILVIGSVVAECLTRDRRAAGSSLTGVTALCP